MIPQILTWCLLFIRVVYVDPVQFKNVIEFVPLDVLRRHDLTRRVFPDVHPDLRDGRRYSPLIDLPKRGVDVVKRRLLDPLVAECPNPDRYNLVDVLRCRPGRVDPFPVRYVEHFPLVVSHHRRAPR
jgi:hypothetical protein